MWATFSDETWKYFREKYVPLLGDGGVVSAGLDNKSKSYRIHLVADLPEGPRKEWRSTPIKRPKGRKTGRDRDAERKFFEHWLPSEGGNVVERLRDSRHRIEAEAETEAAAARSKRPRDCHDSAAEHARPEKRGGKREGAGRPRGSFGPKKLRQR
ncbi:unnamed protein product, partial [Ectocarpus fasciculatus]